MHTPRFWGELSMAGAFDFFRTASRPCRTSWLIVGIRPLLDFLIPGERRGVAPSGDGTPAPGAKLQPYTKAWPIVSTRSLAAAGRRIGLTPGPLAPLGPAPGWARPIAGPRPRSGRPPAASAARRGGGAPPSRTDPARSPTGSTGPR